MSLLLRANRFIARHTTVKPVRLAGQRPVASITFDDFPKSAWTHGGRILADYGARGTYYTAGGFCGRTVGGTVFYDADDLKALAAAGHEIGCHGFGHRPTPTLSRQALAEDAARNEDFLKPFLKGGRARSYAYPYGAASVHAKKFLADRFCNLRGVHPGLNEGKVDLAQLQALSIETRNWNPKTIARAIAQAQHNHSWIVFYTHDVSDNPSPYGATEAMLRTVLEGLKAARIPVLPMREAVRVALGVTSRSPHEAAACKAKTAAAG
jgi:peptidoglycan/xylan/chitin deacetylase (PgdA/CDA1 family)